MSAELEWVDYHGPLAQELVGEVQEEYVHRYGGTDRTPIEEGEFAPPTGGFVVVRRDGEPAGCAGLRGHLEDGSGELKRMYVRLGHRRHGLGLVLLHAVEDRARELGYRRLVMETGLAQPEAIALYVAAGYESIDNFGFYRSSPYSRCFGRAL